MPRSTAIRSTVAPSHALRAGASPSLSRARVGGPEALSRFRCNRSSHTHPRPGAAQVVAGTISIGLQGVMRPAITSSISATPLSAIMHRRVRLSSAAFASRSNAAGLASTPGARSARLDASAERRSQSRSPVSSFSARLRSRDHRGDASAACGRRTVLRPYGLRSAGIRAMRVRRFQGAGAQRRGAVAQTAESKARK